jgi:hypothetical protein
MVAVISHTRADLDEHRAAVPAAKFIQARLATAQIVGGFFDGQQGRLRARHAVPSQADGFSSTAALVQQRADSPLFPLGFSDLAPWSCWCLVVAGRQCSSTTGRLATTSKRRFADMTAGILPPELQIANVINYSDVPTNQEMLDCLLPLVRRAESIDRDQTQLATMSEQQIQKLAADLCMTIGDLADLAEMCARAVRILRHR